MTNPTLSIRLRAVQDELSTLTGELLSLLDDANHIGLAPFRVAHISHAIHDNQAAWDELNELATALELTGAHHKL